MNLLRHFRSIDRTRRNVLGLLTLVAAGLLVFLIVADNPWDPRIAKRIASGRNLRLDDYITIGLWWASLGNLVAVLALMPTARFWLKPLPAEVPLSAVEKPRWFVPLVLAAMGITLAMAWPRMSQSLWGDEEYMLRQSVLGEYRPNSSGQLELVRNSVAENFWNYPNPNNHFLLTLLSRVSIETWRLLFQKEGAAFSETAYRLPSLLAGLLTIPAIAFLLRRAGFPLAGVIAAFVLSLHPWFIKYASESRGYALLMLFEVMLVHALLNGLQTGRWRSWIWFAVCQFCMLYANPAAVPLLVAINVAAAAAFVLKRDREGAWKIKAGRWMIANVLSGMVFIQLFSPCVLPFLKWLERPRAKGEMGWHFVMDFWGHLTTGMAWWTWDGANPYCHAIDQYAAPARWMVGVGMIALLLCGFLLWVRKSPGHAWIAVGLLISAPYGFFQAKSKGNLLYVWYLIYWLPVFALFVSSALASWGEAAGRRFGRGDVFVRWIPAAAFLIFFAWITQRQRAEFRARPFEPQRESVLLTRPTLDPSDPRNSGILTADFVFTTPLYDPLAIETPTPDALRELMRRADAENKPLFVNFGSPGWARHSFPELMRLIEDPRYFDHVETLWGLDPQLTRMVFRYKPGTSQAGSSR